MKKSKLKVTSYNISKQLQEVDFDLDTCFYWIKVKDARNPKLIYEEGEFFVLTETKVYKAFDLSSILEIFGDSVELQEGQIFAEDVLILRLPSESLVDMAARLLIRLVKEKKIQRA